MRAASRGPEPFAAEEAERSAYSREVKQVSEYVSMGEGI